MDVRPIMLWMGRGLAGVLLVGLGACASSDDKGSRIPEKTPAVLYDQPKLGTAAATLQDLDRTLADMARPESLWNVFYMDYSKNLDVAFLEAAHTRGVRYYIVTLEFFGQNLRSIAEGKVDAHLDRVAGQLRKWQVLHPESKLILRPLHEANGDWYDWGFLDGHNGNRAADFKQAWWHLRGRMRASFAGLEFFWCPNGLMDQEKSYKDWYPGDQNVEYVGDDSYNRRTQGQGVWRSPRELRERTIQAIREVAPSKPYIVGETGTTEPWPGVASGRTKAEWFRQLGAWMRGEARKHNILVVIYFNYDKVNESGNDWRIYPEGQPVAEQSREAFREAMRGL